LPLSDRWTRFQLRTIVRRELLDPNARWWTDTELNSYLDDWQNFLQDQLELVWESSEVVTATSTLDISSLVPSMLRLDAVYYNNVRLSGRTKQDLETLRREWRASVNGPAAVYQHSPTSLLLWPPLTTTSTLTLEYPKLLTFASDASYMELPAWTKYSAIPYCTYRAYHRAGPNHNLNKALRRKRSFDKYLHQFRSTREHFFPYHYPTLKPGGRYENDILNPQTVGGIDLAVAITASFSDEVPTGTIDGDNAIFTLSVTPTELQLFKNGLLQHSPTDYSLSGQTITFTTAACPTSGDSLVAWIFRT
jgi:hypothetical protein